MTSRTATQVLFSLVSDAISTAKANVEGMLQSVAVCCLVWLCVHGSIGADALFYSGAGGWRNGLIFDPMEQYGSYSYTSFFLFPLADALNAALTADTQVFFGMQVHTGPTGIA